VHYESASLLVTHFIEHMLSQTLPADLLLNINIPDLPREQINRWEITRLGKRHKSEASVKMRDPKGREVYWIGPAGPGNDVGPGTDFHAIRSGNISVTPIQFDLTRYDILEDVATWITPLDTK
jgi:5'-nucleotidase